MTLTTSSQRSVTDSIVSYSSFHLITSMASVLALEQRGELVAQQAVGLVLEPVHLDRVLVVVGRERAQAAHRAVRLLGRLHDDLGHRDASVGGGHDLVEEQPVGDRVDEVEHVVEPARRARRCPRGRSGVMKVVLSRRTTSWVSASPACSRSSICCACALAFG